MEHLPIGTNEQIRFVLGNRETLRQMFLDDYWDIASRSEAESDIWESIAISAISYREQVQTSPHSDQLYNMLLKKKKLMNEKMKEINEQWQQIYLKEERVEEIWRCYRMLPEHLRIIIYEMEIQKLPWQKVREIHNCSKTSLYRSRDKALKIIRENYFKPSKRMQDKMPKQGKKELGEF